MWTRESIKTYAKGFLRKYYWKAFLVCLILMIFTNKHVGKSTSSRNSYDSYNTTVVENYDRIPLEVDYEGLNIFLRRIGNPLVIYVTLGTYLTILIIYFIIRFTIGSIIEIGKNRFFLQGFREDVDIKYLFSAFNRDEYFDIAKTMFVVSVYNLLWTLLFIIPGIIKSYEYKFVPYILSEYPNIGTSEAILKSRNMTEGHKWNMFVLDLSFLGWILLGLLLCGIGDIFVNPYVETCYARLYNILKEDSEIDEENQYSKSISDGVFTSGDYS